MEERERDKFYSSKPDDADDDDDLELEPPDPTVLDAEARRAQHTMDSTRMSIDVDEIYREVEHDSGRELIENLFRGRRFQFQVKHMLVATAVLAILLTLAQLDLMIFVVVGVMLTIAGVYLYFQWLDKKHQDEADRRRQELYARRREQLASGAAGATTAASTASKPNVAVEPPPPMPSAIDEMWEKENAKQSFQFRFSMQQMLAAMTAAAILFGVVQLAGPDKAATVLGLLALLGLVVHAIGFDPPASVVLGWWFILVLYVTMSIFSALWGSLS